jgi:uncharacterized membrane protein YccC
VKSLDRIVKGDWLGIHFAARIFVATIVVWLLLRLWTDASPIWAISSMIATSDPRMDQAVATFRGRIINGLIGCATGLAMLAVGGANEWKLPVALAASVLLSSYVVRIQVMWRQAPITAAIVVAGALSKHSKLSGMEEGIRRVAEVMMGCVVGLAVTWVGSKVWPLPEAKKEAGKHKP